jgi:hypothetical protein
MPRQAATFLILHGERIHFVLFSAAVLAHVSRIPIPASVKELFAILQAHTQRHSHLAVQSHHGIMRICAPSATVYASIAISAFGSGMLASALAGEKSGPV